MNGLSKIAILLGAVGAIVLVVEEPMTGGSWATPQAGQPAGQASPGANKLSPPFGDHQAQGRRR